MTAGVIDPRRVRLRAALSHLMARSLDPRVPPAQQRVCAIAADTLGPILAADPTTHTAQITAAMNRETRPAVAGVMGEVRDQLTGTALSRHQLSTHTCAGEW
ncbi:hypothetical protein [Williamsia sterculiae]|uniref:Uncharacterized protein n=1 Tax=Williamsia sterculiae TaxID=1344003 RepID=A0A1N7HEM8_9NOCA|nr:hypothetical protein [Williamsia sterculiae]SIS23213.1 hypothetical protein SAMN05445060_4077 [Williamsia sterculiae]